MAYFNPFRPAYLRNPYPALERLRRQDPVHRSPQLDAWVLTAYADCDRVIHDDQAFSSDPAHASSRLGEAVRTTRASVPFGDVPILGNSDPPDHTRLRAIVNRAFTPRTVAGLAPTIEQRAGSLLDGVSPDEPFEFMAGLAEPLAVLTVLEFFGVQPPDRDRLRDWSAAIMSARSASEADPAAIAAARDAGQELKSYLRNAAASASLRPGLLATLMEAEGPDPGLSLDEVVMLLIHISFAGNGPTAFLLGNGALALASHPSQAECLRREPDLLPAAVEELLRFDSPTHIITRFARAPARLRDKSIRTGDTLYLVLGAANRDPQRFPNPDTLDLSRPDNRHLSFGLGIHFCLGAPLARLEAAIAFRILLQRFPNLRLADVQVERGDTFLLRGPRRLRLLP